MWVILALPLGVAALWLLAELVMRAVVERPLRRDFYGSTVSRGREELPEIQRRTGVKVAVGPGWLHLGWIADPESERYRIERCVDDGWRHCGESRFGSFLFRGGGGRFRVWAVPRDRGPERLLGEVEAEPEAGCPPLFAPRIAGPWRTLFRPRRHGHYVNDHCIYRDARGDWRLLGITDRSQGNFDAERYFAVGVSGEFPPEQGMREEAPVADFGELAWAPCVLQEEGRYHLFWSPHRLHQMTSEDGIRWENHRVTLEAPHHRFFRDPMVLRVAEGQWLLYTTARGRYYSRVDLYQSFDLEHWQYIRGALRTGWGSERNSPFASTESPTVSRYLGRYYLALTYNNDSFFWPGLLLLLRRWPNRASYNDTLVFHSESPYDFGRYRGGAAEGGRSPSLVGRLEAHAPEFIRHPERGEWYITTAGWPWVASLSSGEVAVAPLRWEPVRRGRGRAPIV
jgi:hypothetical protein